MKNTVKITSIALVLVGQLVSTMANAQEAPNMNVLERIAPVCEHQDTLTLSKKAIAACNGAEKSMPRLTKKGDRFVKARTGAEFNTLLRNLGVLIK